MIKVITVDDFPNHFEKFSIAANHILPILGYSPQRSEVFVQNNSDLYHDVVFEVACSNGHTVYGRREGWALVYLLPSSWDERYQTIREAIPHIIQWFQERTEDERDEDLRCELSESYPSISAYYGAVLSECGFDIKPRILFKSGQAILADLKLPDLPEGVFETPYTNFSLQDYANVYTEAHKGYQTAPFSLTEEEKLRKCHSYLADAQTHEDVAKTWVAVSIDHKLAGFCYGACRWGDNMSIEELAVLPDYWGKGLGKYLLIRSMQELHRHFPGPDRYFETQSFRDWPRPLRLYSSLGFGGDRGWLEAIYSDK